MLLVHVAEALWLCYRPVESNFRLIPWQELDWCRHWWCMQSTPAMGSGGTTPKQN